MKRVTLDSALCMELDQGPQPIELYDGQGTLIGYFLTKKEFYSFVKPPISEEELQRREQKGGGRTWPEIRTDLEAKYGPAGT